MSPALSQCPALFYRCLGMEVKGQLFQFPLSGALQTLLQKILKHYLSSYAQTQKPILSKYTKQPVLHPIVDQYFLSINFSLRVTEITGNMLEEPLVPQQRSVKLQGAATTPVNQNLDLYYRWNIQPEFGVSTCNIKGYGPSISL